MPDITCERDKYLWIYNESGNRSYGKRNHGRGAYDIILELRPETLLDVGCGKGDLVEWAKIKGIDSTGLDFASGYGVQADLLNIPFFDNTFDVVTAFDVLEHLRPEDLDKGLKELYRVAKYYWILSIGYGRSRIKTPDGMMQLHMITTKDKKWWFDKLNAYGDVSYRGNRLDGDESQYIVCRLKKNG